MILKTLYAGEKVGTTANPSIANQAFTGVDCSGLKKYIGTLIIDLKCSNPELMATEAQIELSSSGGPDIYEWSLNLVDILSLGITTSYQTFNIPLDLFVSTGGEFNVSNINYIRFYSRSSGGNITVSWRNAQISYYSTESKYVYGKDAGTGNVLNWSDSSVNTTNWKEMQRMINKSIEAGKLYNVANQEIVSTYSLVYTVTGAYIGGVLAPNGDIHFVPNSANRGQKIDINGVVSTYSLVYTVANAHFGGVLAPNGDIHFVPYNATVGQKIDINGVVSTYSLVYTRTYSHSGGVLAPNGDIHFIPYNAVVGQKIDINGVVSTYSLIYTVSGAYSGGVLAPNGDIHFVPFHANRGQKIDINGVVSTYSLVYTRTYSHSGGVLAPNGDIHFVVDSANRGQKINPSGVVSTYSVVYTVGDAGAYYGGVLAPNGDIHFIPFSANRGQKIDINGVVSTYSLIYTVTNAYAGGVLAPNGDIHFVPWFANRGQKISTLPAKQFDLGILLSPFYNKY